MKFVLFLLVFIVLAQCFLASQEECKDLSSKKGWCKKKSGKCDKKKNVRMKCPATCGTCQVQIIINADSRMGEMVYSGRSPWHEKVDALISDEKKDEMAIGSISGCYSKIKDLSCKCLNYHAQDVYECDPATKYNIDKRYEYHGRCYSTDYDKDTRIKQCCKATHAFHKKRGCE